MSAKRGAIELFDDFLFRYLPEAVGTVNYPSVEDAELVRQAIRKLEVTPALAPDSPEALRFAAQVVHRLDPRMRQGDTSVAGILEHEALRLEKAACAAAEREALAQRAYEAWRAPTSVAWHDLGDDRKVVWRAVVDALNGNQS